MSTARKQVRGRSFLTVLSAAILGTSLALGGGVASQSSAASSPVDVVDPASITIKPITGTIDEPIVQWASARVDFSYDTTGHDVQPGDTFSIDLPASLGVVPTTFSLREAEANEEVATCVVTPRNGSTAAGVVCTFGDYLKDHRDVAGAVWLTARSVLDTRETSVPVTVNNTVVLVPVPGGIGVDPWGPRPVPTPVMKDGFFTTLDQNEVMWRIDLDSNAYRSSDRITISDQLAAGTSLVPGSIDFGWIEASKYGTNTPFTEAEVTLEAEGHSVMAAVTAPLPADRVYRLSFRVSIDDPSVAFTNGVLSNSALVNGESVANTVRQTTVGGGTGAGTGIGGFSIAKDVVSSGVAAPAGLEYTVDATITAPGGAVTHDTITLAGDGSVQLRNDIPAGTTIALSEVKLPEVAHASWGAPQFTSTSADVAILDAGTRAIITIVEGGVVDVRLTNTLRAVETPAPTPPVPSSPAPSTPAPTTPAPTMPAPTTPATTTPAPSVDSTPSQSTPAVVVVSPSSTPVAPVALPKTGGDLAAGAIAISVLLLMLGLGVAVRARRQIE
ncbi:Ig-like domain-containing protein [Humidisolicoccus flavus]|uniref:Ig-like domain-containing protein n=1 Tax=Humidisolicoccus flavus TaxID=3111414 RepID=UPI0032537B89